MLLISQYAFQLRTYVVRSSTDVLGCLPTVTPTYRIRNTILHPPGVFPHAYVMHTWLHAIKYDFKYTVQTYRGRTIRVIPLTKVDLTSENPTRAI